MGRHALSRQPKLDVDYELLLDASADDLRAAQRETVRLVVVTSAPLVSLFFLL